MKYFIKGIALGLSLPLANRLCTFLGDSSTGDGLLILCSLLIFGIITFAFLLSDNVPNLLLCGFTGLFSMFFFEIFAVFQLIGFGNGGVNSSDWLMSYYSGMYGSIIATVIAIILTVKKIKISDYLIKDGVSMSKELKIKLMLYTIISAIGISYLVLPENAGISVPVFAVIQFVCLWFTVPNRKKLILFLPIFIMSLNCFISANTIWRVSNFLISCVLYCCMFTDFKFKNDNFEFITNTIASIASAFAQFPIPFKWILELNSEKAPIIKRIAIALVIAVPSVIILIAVLSNADMVFSLKTENFITHLSDFINANTLFKIICGIVIALFLFGALYNAYIERFDKKDTSPRFKGDLIIINILLVSVLLVYTLFVIIQFKYLFAGTTLPGELTYTEYARKGFFELLALTGVNIAAILTVIKLTKLHQGKWLSFTKILCHYLCAVTVILLISSFYRMLLYTGDDGLTRLRLFVLGFLIFEAIGLLITFIYIAKPKFNIVLVYTAIALIYYSLLNVIPTDNIIAKNQIDKYLKGERTDIEYIFTLSADAAPSMEYLIDTTEDETIKIKVTEFIEEQTTSAIPARWQRYNLATKNAIHLKNSKIY